MILHIIARFMQSLGSRKTPNRYFCFLLVITQVLDMGLVGYGDGMDPNGGKRKSRHTVRTQRRVPIAVT
jgi:hypothetical protein